MSKRSPMGGAGLLVAIVALVAALTGAAIGLPGKGSVDSGDIRKNAVKARHLAASALKCPNDMRRVGALCYDKAPNGENSWIGAAYSCAEQGRQLPSHAELLRVAHSNKFPRTPSGEELWTSPHDSANNVLTIIKMTEDDIVSLVRPTASSFVFHCVREATP